MKVTSATSSSGICEENKVAMCMDRSSDANHSLISFLESYCIVHQGPGVVFRGSSHAFGLWDKDAVSLD